MKSEFAAASSEQHSEVEADAWLQACWLNAGSTAAAQTPKPFAELPQTPVLKLAPAGICQVTRIAAAISA